MSPGSERAIISICLTNNDKLIDVESAGITAESFGIDANRYVYIAMQYLYSKRNKTDATAILEVITSENGKKAIEEIGGLSYIGSLFDAYVDKGSLGIFIEKVKQAYTRRSIYMLCNETKVAMLSENTSTMNGSELVGILESKVNDLSNRSVTMQEAYKMGTNTDVILEERANNPARIPGLEVGWKKLDKLTGGMQPGDFTVVCARSKVGKSVTLLNWAIALGIDQQLPVLYIDTEMTSREQEDRLLANICDIPHAEIMSGLYALDTEAGTADEKILRIAQAKVKLAQGNLFHIYMPDMNIDKIKAVVKKYKQQYGICAVFFDYLKLTSNQIGSLKSAQEWQMLGFLACTLKELAGQMNIPIVAGVQENRTDERGTQKGASNIAGSDRILQNATKLMFLYNKPEEDIAMQGIHNGNQQLKIAYQRNGESDCEPINIMFNRPYIKQVECGEWGQI